MTIENVILFSIIIALFLLAIWLGKKNAQDQQQLRAEWEKFKRERRELYSKLADPNEIVADFEKSARAREMRDANRTTLPREGAGPPARVFRPKLRGKKPGNWRQNRT
jgi:hypothetical protein